MLPTLGPDRRATYSPFLPISPKTGRVLQVPTLERDAARGTIVFEDEDGARTEVPVTGGHVKLQWKPDWAMRWAALGIDYEMSGKDLIDSVKVSTRICKVLDGTPPDGFTYELFLDAEGAKISKSKGNGLSLEDWLRYGPSESLAFYLFQSPRSAKRLYFDVIPRAADEYLQSLDAYPGQPEAKRIDSPVWHVHDGAPAEPCPVSFGLLLNLVSASGASDKAILWGFIDKYAPGTTPQTHPLVDRMADGALHYYEDFVRPNKRFRRPTTGARRHERLARAPACAARRLPGRRGDPDSRSTKPARRWGSSPCASWFAALYEVLLGQPQGPRFGSFAAIFGLERTIALVEDALAGRLA